MKGCNLKAVRTPNVLHKFLMKFTHINIPKTDDLWIVNVLIYEDQLIEAETL